MVRLLLMIIATSVLFAGTSLAQEKEKKEKIPEGWRRSGETGVNFSQIGVHDWSGGGEDALSLASFASVSGNLKKGVIAWDNTLELRYGISKLGEGGTRKTDDLLALNSKFSRKAIGNWSYTGLVDFRTQFSSGYDYSSTPKVKTSEFMAPGYLTVSVGGQYKPHDNFFAFVSPITGKTTFVMDDTLADRGAYGVDPGDNIRSQYGAYVDAFYRKPLMKNVTVKTKLTLFLDYQDPFVDVNWETGLLMKVNKYITTTFSTFLIIDDDVKNKKGDTATQFKEILAVGILYNF